MAVNLPRNQKALLLFGPQQPYHLVQDHELPQIVRDDELLVRTQVVGLNPVDWKSPDYNFGIPSLPFISGRELVGQVVRPPKSSSRFQEGDQIIVISTDYRDVRKGSFQDYVVASEFNALKLPESISCHVGASFGVPFVAAALTLGICFGLDFTGVSDGPDMLRLVRGLDPASLPSDVLDECLNGIELDKRAGPGDWVAVWGGSSATAGIVTQLARLAGMHVLLAINQAKHGLRVVRSQALRPDILVDSHDCSRASSIIRDTIGGDCRFALDTQGRNSAEMLAQALRDGGGVGGGGKNSEGTATTATTIASPDPQDPATVSPPSSPGEPNYRHVVGLSGLPKSPSPTGVSYHSVPIKLFHEVPEIGSALSTWLERLLHSGSLIPPDVLVVEEGYEGVNRGLDKMRRNEVSGGRAVVDLRFAPE